MQSQDSTSSEPAHQEWVNVCSYSLFMTSLIWQNFFSLGHSNEIHSFWSIPRLLDRKIQVSAKATSPNFTARLHGWKGPDCLLATTTENGCFWGFQETRKGGCWWTELQYCHHKFHYINLQESNIPLQPWLPSSKPAVILKIFMRYSRQLTEACMRSDLWTLLIKLKAVVFLNVDGDQKLWILLLWP